MPFGALYKGFKGYILMTLEDQKDPARIFLWFCSFSRPLWSVDEQISALKCAINHAEKLMENLELRGTYGT